MSSLLGHEHLQISSSSFLLINAEQGHSAARWKGAVKKKQRTVVNRLVARLDADDDKSR